ncbi:conserved hypothetical protein [Trichinella spiralis]|uniref:hypothetical protein n=1 Tax=Trichinella spiralis TaxID=6334 RepID=UPI0001EFBD7C|nr:conserved hypothetical protein [Trichinella spiralis]
MFAGVSSSSVVFIGRDNLLVFPEQRAQSPPDCMWDVVRQFRHCHSTTSPGQCLYACVTTNKQPLPSDWLLILVLFALLFPVTITSVRAGRVTVSNRQMSHSCSASLWLRSLGVCGDSRFSHIPSSLILPSPKCNGLPFFLIIVSGTTHNEKDQALFYN